VKSIAAFGDFRRSASRGGAGRAASGERQKSVGGSLK
jgi:hypothetical protein